MYEPLWISRPPVTVWSLVPVLVLLNVVGVTIALADPMTLDSLGV